MIRRGGKSIAIEIETGKSDPLGNIKKALEGGFESVLSIALDKQTKDELQRQLALLPEDLRERVRVWGRGELIEKAKTAEPGAHSIL